MADLKVCVMVLTSLIIPAILQKCDERKDVVFLVDSSGSVKARNFQKVRIFVSDFVQKLDIGESKIRLSVVRFSSVITKILWLDESFDKTEIANTIKAVRYNGGGTKTGEALRFAYQEVLEVVNGDREEVSDLVFVITDGKSKNPTITQSEAKLLHDKGVDVVAIGVGSGVDVNELLHIASDKDFALRVDNFDQLNNETLHKKIFTAACKGLKPTTPVTTTELLPEVSEALTSTESLVGSIEEISSTTSEQTVQPSDDKSILTIQSLLLVENTTVPAFSGGSLTSDQDPRDSTIDLKQFTSTEQIITDDSTTVEQNLSRQTTSSFTVTESNFEDSTRIRTKDTSSYSVTGSNFVDSISIRTPDTSSYSVTGSNSEDSTSIRTPNTSSYSVTGSNFVDSISIRTPDTSSYSVTESNSEDSTRIRTPNTTASTSNNSSSTSNDISVLGRSNAALRLFKDWRTVAGLTALSGLVIVASLGGIIWAVRRKKNSNIKEIKQYD